MKNFKNLLFIVLFFITATVLGQTKITGTIVDETNQPLPGASILEKGTANGTESNFDGKFTLEAKSNSGVLVISYIGYKSREVAFSSSRINLGSIKLSEDANSLDEIVIQGVIDVARDRKTPVAVSTIKAAEIEEKLGSQEFPEILKSTPSVYATKSGGGFGDSRISIRGFSQENVAVLINGVPVNDMENGRVFWSNWAGLSDVTSAMQVQRGLGSSKLAIASVGGTINVITKTSEQSQGGSVTASFGNDGYFKSVASYSTGKLDNGLSASFLLSRTQGDGYVDGTEFLGHNYFIAFGYKINEKHSVEFTFTGAPQWHHQRSFAERISTYQQFSANGEPNIKYNSAWGILNGEEFSFRRNFYHKPVMSLNYDWKISDSANISTVLYGSWGRGGGSGPIGDVNNIRDFDLRLRDANGVVRFEDIVKWNSGGSVPDFGADRTSTINDRSNGLTRRSSMNSHNWYGIVANFHKVANENFTWDFGVDMRTYKGIHYRVVSDLLGATGYTDNRDKNNPNRNITNFVDPTPSWNPFQNITEQQKIEYYYDGNVRWLGFFGQVEYSKDNISSFLQAGVSRQGFQRVDYFNLAPADQKSSFESLNGGNIKGGINWNINEKSNVFANTGYYSKQPFFNAVYPNFNNNDTNVGLTNEKIFGLEFGYGFKGENYNLKVNAYRTSWKDRFLRSGPSNTNPGGFVNFSGVTQVHTGIELEANARLNKFTVNGMLSVGNYKYQGNVTGTEYDQDNNVVGVSGTTYYLEGVKVGDAAQTTAQIGLTFKATDALKFDVSQTFAANVYPTINAASFKTQADNDLGSLKLPNYSLMDLGASYKFNLTDKMDARFRLNVNNVFDTVYISDGNSNIHVNASTVSTYKGIDTKNNVYFGYGRTWNASLKFSF